MSVGANVQRVLDKLNGVKAIATGWIALCPAHPDHAQSLAVAEGDGARVLLHCHAGCKTEDIVERSGLAMKDLFPQEEPKVEQPRKIVATYEYKDEEGHVLYEVVRFLPKGFSQRRPLIGGGYEWGLGNVRRVLYRLEDIAKAKQKIKPVWIVEGEKDAWALKQLGLTATTNSGGAGKWTDEYTSSLLGIRGAVIVPDSDLPGRKHAKTIGESLTRAGIKTKIVHLPTPHKDVSEYITAGGTADSLLDLARQAPEYDNSYNPEDGQPIVIDQDPTRSWAEDASAFLAGEDKPLNYLVHELVPEGVIVLLHGEPRVRKSWLAIDIAVAGALGGQVVGLERFKVETPFKVLYSSQEDQRRDVRTRVKRFLKGRGVSINGTDPTNGNLSFAIHKGIELEDPKWQEAMIRDIGHWGVRMLVLDPIRRYSANVDKGPAEVRAVTSFLRRLVVETGCSVVIVHHDVKPPQQQRSDGTERRRSHRASGGDWFAASECPIICEPAGKGNTLVIPEDYKLSEDPKPFLFSIGEDAHMPGCTGVCMMHKTWARLCGETTDGEDLASLPLKERILEYLSHAPMKNASAIAAGTKIARMRVLELLQHMEQEGRVDSVPKGRAILWAARGEERHSPPPRSDGELSFYE